MVSARCAVEGHSSRSYGAYGPLGSALTIAATAWRAVTRSLPVAQLGGCTMGPFAVSAMLICLPTECGAACARAGLPRG